MLALGIDFSAGYLVLIAVFYEGGASRKIVTARLLLDNEYMSFPIMRDFIIFVPGRGKSLIPVKEGYTPTSHNGLMSLVGIQTLGSSEL